MLKNACQLIRLFVVSFFCYCYSFQRQRRRRIRKFVDARRNIFSFYWTILFHSFLLLLPKWLRKIFEKKKCLRNYFIIDIHFSSCKNQFLIRRFLFCLFLATHTQKIIFFFRCDEEKIISLVPFCDFGIEHWIKKKSEGKKIFLRCESSFSRLAGIYYSLNECPFERDLTIIF